MVEELDCGLINFSKVTKNTLNVNFENFEGAGAAGGLGYAFLSFLNAKLESGINIVIDEINLDSKIQNSDIVITGEGRLDNQTAMGKAPIGVAKLAKKYNKKVIALAGSLSDDAKECNKEGIDAYFSIVNSAMSLNDAMNKDIATKNMILTTEQIFNLIKTIKS